jgi:hypothetical protein
MGAIASQQIKARIPTVGPPYFAVLDERSDQRRSRGFWQMTLVVVTQDIAMGAPETRIKKSGWVLDWK